MSSSEASVKGSSAGMRESFASACSEPDGGDGEATRGFCAAPAARRGSEDSLSTEPLVMVLRSGESPQGHLEQLEASKNRVADQQMICGVSNVQGLKAEQQNLHDYLVGDLVGPKDIQLFSRKTFNGWADLPEHILMLILQHVRPTIDYLRFGSTCRSWRSLATKENYGPFHQLPWLMLSEENYPAGSDTRLFFSPSDGKIHELALPEARQKRVISSSEGWLAMLGMNQEMFMLNPMTFARIPLPPQSSFNANLIYDGPNLPHALKTRVFVKKVILCPAVPPPGYTAVAIYSIRQKVAIAQPGDRAWTDITRGCTPYDDVLMYKGLVYAVSCEGHVSVCDIERWALRRSKQVAMPPDDKSCWHRYLVELSGRLLQVARNYGAGARGTAYRTTEFRVYELDLNHGKWSKVESLGGHALFLGGNRSMSVLASNLLGCRPNCIYFTDDNLLDYWREDAEEKDEDAKIGHDMGVFSLEDGSIEPHYPGCSSSPHSPPLWFTPTLWLPLSA